MSVRGLLFVSGVALLLLAASVLWHEFAFKYVFEFVTSGGLLGVGLYYLLRTSVANNVAKGLTFFLLSIVFYGVGELMLGAALPAGPDLRGGNSALHDLLATQVAYGALRFPVWQLSAGLGLLTNAIVLARNPKLRIFVAANGLCVVTVAILFLVSR